MLFALESARSSVLARGRVLTPRRPLFYEVKFSDTALARAVRVELAGQRLLVGGWDKRVPFRPIRTASLSR